MKYYQTLWLLFFLSVTVANIVEGYVLERNRRIHRTGSIDWCSDHPKSATTTSSKHSITTISPVSDIDVNRWFTVLSMMTDDEDHNEKEFAMNDDDDDGEEEDIVLGEGIYDTVGGMVLDDLSWRVEKLRLEEQNIQRFLKARPRFLPYNECRKWVQAFSRWTTQDDWNEWIAMGEKRNAYIPSRPDEYYGRLGQWVSWDHFLIGNSRKYNNNNINVSPQPRNTNKDYDADNDFR